MATIHRDDQLYTLVDVFTVAPENQERLLAVLDQAIREVMQPLPGFVRARLHASLDGTRVVTYAQWTSPEAYEAMVRHPRAEAYVAAALQLASSDAQLYALHAAYGAPAASGD